MLVATYDKYIHTIMVYQSSTQTVVIPSMHVSTTLLVKNISWGHLFLSKKLVKYVASSMGGG